MSSWKIENPKSPIQNGFTLIELLVVVAIIAVLASLLLPALSTARDRARTTACMNNQKQTLLALRMYADDFTEQGFPGVHETQKVGTQPGIKYAWLYDLGQLEYLSDEKSAWCTAPPDNYGYNNLATWNKTVGSGVPNDKRLDPLFVYCARARNFARLGSTGTTNVPIGFGRWTSPMINGTLHNVNITQFDWYWEKMPDSRRTAFLPILACSLVVRLPASGAVPGFYYYPQGTWVHRAAHRDHTTSNYGNTDGSVSTIGYPAGDFNALSNYVTSLWRGVWSID